ncbi:integrase catalytic domain-containing protein [Trichonephila clavipes]|nr:integrase catalytic domain-containing protein [Trichonephila clavipes]
MDSLTRLKRLVVQHFTYDALIQVDKSLLGSCAPNQRGISPNEIQHYELWWLGSPLFYHYIELEPYDITAVEGYDLFLQELKETSDFPLCALLKNIEPLDIISNCSSFTKFQRVIAWCAEATLANIRNSFWIPSARNVVRKILRTCITCRKVSAKGSQQLMANLPAARVTACRVFSQVGIDYCGPFQLKTFL